MFYPTWSSIFRAWSSNTKDLRLSYDARVSGNDLLCVSPAKQRLASSAMNSCISLHSALCDLGKPSRFNISPNLTFVDSAFVIQKNVERDKWQRLSFCNTKSKKRNIECEYTWLNFLHYSFPFSSFFVNYRQTKIDICRTPNGKSWKCI